jgi:quinol monooxygenase YgiN
MIIVAGHLTVAPKQRAMFLADALAVIAAARAAPGCIDFHLTADPINPARINIFEHWDSTDAVEAFRGTGPSSEQQATILAADVHQHTIAASVRL